MLGANKLEIALNFKKLFVAEQTTGNGQKVDSIPGGIVSSSTTELANVSTGIGLMQHSSYLLSG